MRAGTALQRISLTPTHLRGNLPFDACFACVCHGAILPFTSSLVGQTSSPRNPRVHFGHHALIATASGKKVLPGAIDGSVHPELIPDSTAYRVFFRSFTADADQARRLAMLHRAHLSGSDLTGIAAADAHFESLRTAYLAQSSAALASAQSAGVPFNQEALIAQQTAIGTQMKADLQARLSPAGMNSLDALIQSEKRHMTIFPMPDMSGAK